MDLLGQKVGHKDFGTGVIAAHNGHYIIVSFDVGEKKFAYPDSFKHFLKFEDTLADGIVKEALVAIEKKDLPEKTNMNKKVADIPKKRRISFTGKRVKDKTPHRYSIAFKCNYCDGGQSPEQVGFNGVCSDKIIHNNISIEKRAWCSYPESPCRLYYDRLITRKELEEQVSGTQSVCYESKMLRDWQAYAGGVLSDKNKGKPFTLKKVQPYSLCVLTTRDPGSLKESDRYIFAVFLVDETYTGDARDAGYVTSSSKYKLKLSPQEAHSMLFWKYHANGNNPQVAAWNSGLFRYIGDREGALILRDITAIKRGTADEHLAQELLQYFCRIIEIDPEQLGDPTGALCL